MKMTGIPVVNGVLRRISIRLVKGQEDLEARGKVETIQTTALLGSARTQIKVLETLGDLLSLKFYGKIISERWREKFSKW